MADDVVDAQAEDLKKRAETLRPEYPEVTFKSFLEETPPDTYVYVVDLKHSADGRLLETPDITFFCEGAACDGQRIFTCRSNIVESSEWRREFLTYQCRNCGARLAIFAISYSVGTLTTATSPGKATCMKLGQIPTFGPRTPPRLISLIGPDKEVFLQGRRAENRGLGIGAFAYYRRVVENQKNRIIAEIARVAKLLGSTAETEALFTAAMKETQFTKSVEMVKNVIPQTLLISGQNPLTLLHSALSKGLHDSDMSDERCLQLAQSIRTILAELAERAAEALKSDKEIQSALSILMAVQGGSKAKPEK